MSSTTDLLAHALEKNPIEFADTFNELIRQKAADALEAHRIELAQSIYGAPEDASDADDDLPDVGEDDTEDYFDDEDDDLDLDDLDLDDLDLDDEDNTDEDA